MTKEEKEINNPEDFSHKTSPLPLLGMLLGKTISNETPSPPFDIPSLLGSLAAAQVRKRRQYFLNETIKLDGFYFEECRFDQCVLFTETGDVHLKDCVIGPGTSLQIGSRLVNLAKLFWIFGLFPPGWQPTLRKIGDVFTVSIP